MRTEYDIYTAVTFLMVGLGVGAVVALMLAPRPRVSFGETRVPRNQQQPREERASA